MWTAVVMVSANGFMPHQHQEYNYCSLSEAADVIVLVHGSTSLLLKMWHG